MLDENHGCFCDLRLEERSFDKQYLAMLGCSLRATKDQLALADVADKSSKDRSVSSDNKVTFVRCCCDKGSLLSRPTEGKDMRTTDVTKEMISRMPTR